MNKNLEQQIIAAMVTAKKKPKVSLPVSGVVKKCVKKEKIMIVAQWLADK